MILYLSNDNFSGDQVEEEMAAATNSTSSSSSTSSTSTSSPFVLVLPNLSEDQTLLGKMKAIQPLNSTLVKLYDETIANFVEDDHEHELKPNVPQIDLNPEEYAKELILNEESEFYQQVKRLLRENLIIRAAQNKTGVGYRDGLTKPQRRVFASNPQVKEALGSETNKSFPICDSIISPSVQLLLFGYVLTEEDELITAEMLFEFKAQSSEFFEQCKVTRQMALNHFLKNEKGGVVMVNDIAYLFLKDFEDESSNCLQIPVNRCIGGILPGVTLNQLDLKELRAISMAFAEEKVPKASGDYELVQRIFLLNRAVCWGNYPRFSPSDVWLCDPNIQNMRSIIAPAGSLGYGTYLSFNEDFLYNNLEKVVLCEGQIVLTSNGLVSPRDYYNVDAYCLAHKPNSNNNYGMQMDITIGQGIGIGGPGFICNNACGDKAMFGFDKFGFSSYGEVSVLLNIIALRNFKGIEILERAHQTKKQIPFDVQSSDGKKWKTIPISVHYGWGLGDSLCQCQENCQGKASDILRTELRILNHGELSIVRDSVQYHADMIDALPKNIFSPLNKSQMKSFMENIQSVPILPPILDSERISNYFQKKSKTLSSELVQHHVLPPLHNDSLNDTLDDYLNAYHMEDLDSNSLDTFFKLDSLSSENRSSLLNKNFQLEITGSDGSGGGGVDGSGGGGDGSGGAGIITSESVDQWLFKSTNDDSSQYKPKGSSTSATEKDSVIDIFKNQDQSISLPVTTTASNEMMVNDSIQLHKQHQKKKYSRSTTTPTTKSRFNFTGGFAGKVPSVDTEEVISFVRNEKVIPSYKDQLICDTSTTTSLPVSSSLNTLVLPSSLHPSSTLEDTIKEKEREKQSIVSIPATITSAIQVQEQQEQQQEISIPPSISPTTFSETVAIDLAIASSSTSEEKQKDMCLLIAKIKEFSLDPSEIIPLFNKLGVTCISHILFIEESDFAHLKPVQSRLLKRLIQSLSK